MMGIVACDICPVSCAKCFQPDSASLITGWVSVPTEIVASIKDPDHVGDPDANQLIDQELNIQQ